MTEVLRPGHLGFVPGPESGPDGIRILHLVPHSFSAPDFKYHGSTKDIATRREYFHERGLGYDTFHHRKNVDKLSQKLGWLQDLPDYTHVLVDGAHTRADLEFLRQRWPNARHILRSHNCELPHRKDTLRATLAATETDDMDQQAQDKANARMNIRVFWERDRAAADYADVILSIETSKWTERYWRRAQFKGEVLSQPYFLTEEYREEIEREIAGRGQNRKDMILCVMSSHPGALIYHALMRFHMAVTGIGQRRPGWRFRATGRSFWMKSHPALSQRIKHMGIIDDLMGALCEVRATAVLSELGRGFKTKILEAILCKTWVLVTPLLFKRLPPEVQPYCIVLDPEAPLAMDEAIDRIERRQWPEGDPNGELKKSAYAALDRAIYGSAVALPISEHHAASDDSPDVTFCTVLTPVHLRLASHNYELTKRLNPGVQMRWNVTDNNDIHLNDKRMKAFLHKIAKVRGKVHPELRSEYMQKAKSEYFDYGEINDGLPGARVFQGLTLEEAYAYYYNQLGATPETEEAYKAYLAKCLGSYHHASGLNLVLENVKTRYAIVVDPDFYVVRPNWVREIIDHMSKNDLAVFGAPWNPRWYQKFRYFPCTHLMVIDLHKLPYKRDMLAPDLVRPGGKYISLFWQGYREFRQHGLKFTAKTILKNARIAWSEDMRQRTTIAMSRDTGYTLAGEFAKGNGLKAGTISAVYKSQDGFTPNTVFGPQRLLDKVMPDDRSYLPKRPGNHVDKGFADYNFPDYRGLGWEEFVWKGAPFSFHVRGEVHRKPIGRADDVQVLNMLNATLRHIGHPPIADRTTCGADLDAINAESWDDFEKDRASEGKAVARDLMPG